MQTIGTCGKCGGPVQVPTMWGGSVPPQPKCAHCGAVPAAAYGPVLPMQGGVRIDAVGTDGCKATTETVAS